MFKYLHSKNIIYRDLGMTYVAPDYETIAHMTNVADNFNINYI